MIIIIKKRLNASELRMGLFLIKTRLKSYENGF